MALGNTDSQPSSPVSLQLLNLTPWLQDPKQDHTVLATLGVALVYNPQQNGETSVAWVVFFPKPDGTLHWEHQCLTLHIQ